MHSAQYCNSLQSGHIAHTAQPNTSKVLYLQINSFYFAIEECRKYAVLILACNRILDAEREWTDGRTDTQTGRNLYWHGAYVAFVYLLSGQRSPPVAMTRPHDANTHTTFEYKTSSLLSLWKICTASGQHIFHTQNKNTRKSKIC